eukprot:TRINITY_DN4395_c0_g1_i1.p1 TRINITY_DN4395_c0_g1~~TRINITY_DN4395_c0_g1_i1.p1  ORF type:complete len:855 (+),score=233.21 TRINITY_DN4395_c0_g1_i1:91-2565(+)
MDPGANSAGVAAALAATSGPTTGAASTGATSAGATSAGATSAGATSAGVHASASVPAAAAAAAPAAGAAGASAGHAGAAAAGGGGAAAAAKGYAWLTYFGLGAAAGAAGGALGVLAARLYTEHFVPEHERDDRTMSDAATYGVSAAAGAATGAVAAPLCIAAWLPCGGVAVSAAAPFSCFEGCVGGGFTGVGVEGALAKRRLRDWWGRPARFELGTRGVLEAEDEYGRWWEVTVARRDTEAGTVHVQVHDGEGTEWKALRTDAVRELPSRLCAGERDKWVLRKLGTVRGRLSAEGLAAVGGAEAEAVCAAAKVPTDEVTAADLRRVFGDVLCDTVFHRLLARAAVQRFADSSGWGQVPSADREAVTDLLETFCGGTESAPIEALVRALGDWSADMGPDSIWWDEGWSLRRVRPCVAACAEAELFLRGDTAPADLSTSRELVYSRCAPAGADITAALFGALPVPGWLQKPAVLGCAADLDAGTLSFGLNGRWEAPFGVAFRDVSAAGGGLCPAVTACGGMRILVRLGPPWMQGPPAGYDGVSAALGGCPLRVVLAGKGPPCSPCRVGDSGEAHEVFFPPYEGADHEDIFPPCASTVAAPDYAHTSGRVFYEVEVIEQGQWLLPDGHAAHCIGWAARDWVSAGGGYVGGDEHSWGVDALRRLPPPEEEKEEGEGREDTEGKEGKPQPAEGAEGGAGEKRGEGKEGDVPPADEGEEGSAEEERAPQPYPGVAWHNGSEGARPWLQGPGVRYTDRELRRAWLEVDFLQKALSAPPPPPEAPEAAPAAPPEPGGGGGAAAEASGSALAAGTEGYVAEQVSRLETGAIEL